MPFHLKPLGGSTVQMKMLASHRESRPYVHVLLSTCSVSDVSRPQLIGCLHTPQRDHCDYSAVTHELLVQILSKCKVLLLYAFVDSNRINRIAWAIVNETNVLSYLRQDYLSFANAKLKSQVA